MIDWLAQQCSENLLTEKWLLAQHLPTAVQWKDRVNLRGSSTINLHAKTLPTLAVSLATGRLVKDNLRFASQATVRMMIRSLLVDLLQQEQLEYFGTIKSTDGPSRLLAQTIRDLRLADLQPNEFDDDCFETKSKASDIRRIYRAYLDVLTEQQVVDFAGCLRLVIDGLSNGTIVLPEGLLILMPDAWRLEQLERQLIDSLAARAAVRRPPQSDADVTPELAVQRIAGGGASVNFLGGLGEVNEVRGVFQRVLFDPADAPRLDDVEILYTDPLPYVPLVLEQLSGWLADQKDGVLDLDDLPVTFSEGIPAIYSRPGRALRSWLRWIRHDGVQTRAVQMIREGLLVRPEEAETIGYSRLADALRQIPIGFALPRYRVKISDAIRSAERSLNEYQQRGAKEIDDDDQRDRDFGLPALRAVLGMIGPLVDWAPGTEVGAESVLERAKRFLLQSARADNKLDRLGRNRLLDEIEAMIATLALTPSLAGNQSGDWSLLQWLEELPLNSCVLASGQKPGCVHVAPLSQGGHSGRRQIFIIGLDDGRYPRRVINDSILLDNERSQLSANLSTAQTVFDDTNQALHRVLARLVHSSESSTGAPLGLTLCVSYSSRNLLQDRANFPSATMLELYRATEQQEDADLSDLLKHLGSPVSFIDQSKSLSATEQILADLLAEGDESRRRQMVEQAFWPSQSRGIALRAQANDEFSAYDGLVPAAGAVLDPTSQPRVSASRMETMGTCPRRFLFKHGLSVYPPDEWIVDRERWLDPLQLGNLVHGLFEQFMMELTSADQVPNFQRDRVRLLRLLEEKVSALRQDVPIPNQDAYRRTLESLEETCDIFLINEEAYCRENYARPWVLEASLGLDEEPRSEVDCREPIGLTLSDGRLLRVGGRLDRVDRLMSEGSERYAIWDYKSGSSFGFDQQEPFQQGRKLQPFLYVGMLRHRLAAMGRSTDAAQSFGYFFPSPRTEGLRLRWSWADLRGGDVILKNISDLISSGSFIATTNSDDCRFCDYAGVCGDAPEVVSLSQRKTSRSSNSMLSPWRDLREIPEESAS